MEQNIEFVRKRRDEAAFSPTDQQSAESFLQVCILSQTFSVFDERNMSLAF